MTKKTKLKKLTLIKLPYKVYDEDFTLYDKLDAFIVFSTKKVFQDGHGFCTALKCSTETLAMLKVNLPSLYSSFGTRQSILKKRIIIDDSIKLNHISPVYRTHVAEAEGAVALNGRFNYG
jgi:hypothetical protein